jgi:hypothetical protein
MEPGSYHHNQQILLLQPVMRGYLIRCLYYLLGM